LSDDLTRAVNAPRVRADAAVVEGGVGATTEKEAVSEDVISADDLARVVDAEGLGATGGIGIVEGGEGIDGHDTAFLSLSHESAGRGQLADPGLHSTCRRGNQLAGHQSQRPIFWTRQPQQ
jgi:hypothetical protein